MPSGKRTGNRGHRSWGAVCFRCKKEYTTTTKHPRYGRCPNCDRDVEQIYAAIRWIHQGSRVKGRRAGFG